MSENRRPEEKKPYEKPELRVIEMKEEEVLAIGCKMVGGANAFGGLPDCGIANNCVQMGS